MPVPPSFDPEGIEVFQCPQHHSLAVESYRHVVLNPGDFQGLVCGPHFVDADLAALSRLSRHAVDGHSHAVVRPHNVPLRGGLHGSNLGLSMARAGSVAEFLLRSTSIDPTRLSTMGFGEYRPQASNDTAQGRQKNRRVEIIVTI